MDVNHAAIGSECMDVGCLSAGDQVLSGTLMLFHFPGLSTFTWKI